MKIFICKECQRYCNVEAGMLSECCKAEVYNPNEKEQEHEHKNPAV